MIWLFSGVLFPSPLQPTKTVEQISVKAQIIIAINFFIVFLLCNIATLAFYTIIQEEIFFVNFFEKISSII